MSCRESVVDLRVRGVRCANRITHVPPLHPSPGSWTIRLKRRLQSEVPNPNLQAAKNLQTAITSSQKMPGHAALEDLGLGFGASKKWTACHSCNSTRFCCRGQKKR